jgi:hypothetical protein
VSTPIDSITCRASHIMSKPPRDDANAVEHASNELAALGIHVVVRDDVTMRNCQAPVFFFSPSSDFSSASYSSSSSSSPSRSVHFRRSTAADGCGPRR